MLPLVKVLSSKSTAELSTAINAYLGYLAESNAKNGDRYSLRSITYKVTPLSESCILYSALIIVNDISTSYDDDKIELPF